MLRPDSSQKKKRGRPFASKQVNKELILDIAIEEFGNKGFDGTKQKDIARKAGVSNPVLNYHFKDKDDLWRQSVLQLAKKFKIKYDEISGYFKDLDGVSALKAYTRQVVYFSAEQPAFHKIVFHEMCTKTERADWLFSTVLEPFHQFIDNNYSPQKNGKLEFKGYPAANLSSLIIGASNIFFVHAFQMEKMYGVNPFDKEEIEKHADIVVDLLFARFDT